MSQVAYTKPSIVISTSIKSELFTIRTVALTSPRVPFVASKQSKNPSSMMNSKECFPSPNPLNAILYSLNLSTSLDVKRRKDNTKTKNKKRKAKKKTELTKLTSSILVF